MSSHSSNYFISIKNVSHFFLKILPYIIILLFTFAYILLALNRYWQFESGYYDLGIFDTALWKVAHFQTPIIDHFKLSGKNIFADHFHPSIFILAPIYWFTDKTEAILVAQAIIVGLSGVVLFHIAKDKLRNAFAAISIVIAYFLFIGLQNALAFDFHEVTVMTLPLMLLYWAIFTEKKKLYYIFLIYLRI